MAREEDQQLDQSGTRAKTAPTPILADRVLGGEIGEAYPERLRNLVEDRAGFNRRITVELLDELASLTQRLRRSRRCLPIHRPHRQDRRLVIQTSGELF